MNCKKEKALKYKKELACMILSPEKFFGFKLGADRKLAHWDKIVEYFLHLQKNSPCVKVVELGKSTMGHPFIIAIISSPENLENLENIRKMSWLISHPKGLIVEEVEKLTKKGKVVFSMTMSVHGSEIGGTQMSPELAYEVATSEDPDVEKIRENVVFLLFPSTNPDGNILVVDWYNKWLGTAYEGVNIAYLYHKYVGHDNNRDAFTLNQVESELIARVWYKEWYPQAQIDFHHMGSFECRFSIPPHTDPIYEHVDPLVWAEQQLYGGIMLVELEAAGKTGVETQCTYPGDMSPAWDDSPCLHNITGMLTESASAKLATPIYIHPQQLGPARRGRPEYRPQIVFPHPWPGGWWKLQDIVEQQKIAAIAALKCAANYKDRILHNMYLKVKRQIELGRSESPYAFIFSPNQHDWLTASKLLQVLQAADVEVQTSKETFNVDGVTYPKGTYIIFTSQTCRPYILKLLKRTFYHDGPSTRRPDGAPIPPYDLATHTLMEFMNVKVIEALKPFKGKFEICDKILPPKGVVEDSEQGYLLNGRLNESYVVINILLNQGVQVQRVIEPIEGFPKGAFYIPPNGLKDELKKLADNHHITFHATKSASFKKIMIKQLKVGIYQRYWGGNAEEGWTRWLFEKYGFKYTSLKDAEIKKGELIDNYNVIILPNDPKCLILGEGIEEYYRKTNPKYILPNYPPEYQSGIGKEGVEKLREFIEAGGSLITIGQASDFAIEELKIPLENIVRDIDSKEFLCPGSTLKVNIDLDHPLAYGISEETQILFGQAQIKYPIFDIKQSPDNDKCEVVVKYPEERILQSGWLIGEKYFSKKGALIVFKLGKGRVVLFGFSPHCRAQTNGTFKFLFNCLLG